MRQKIILLILAAFLGAYETVAQSVRSERSDMETRFIERLKSWPGTTMDDWEVDISEAATYKDSMLVLPGKHYIIPHVSSTTYHAIDEEGDVFPVVDPDLPVESLANIFLLPLEEGREIPLDITFLTHEYGSKARLTTTVDKFVSLCQADGCEVYFGVERNDPGNLVCSLFLYNRAGGYDHVARLDCDPDEVLGADGRIFARVSLYVPTDNVETLYQQLPDGPSSAKKEFDRQQGNGK